MVAAVAIEEKGCPLPQIPLFVEVNDLVHLRPNAAKIYISSMCGRFTYRLTWREIVRLYRLPLDTPARNTQPRYNICPTDTIDAVTERDDKRDCVSMRWGLVPFWWSKPLKEL